MQASEYSRSGPLKSSIGRCRSPEWQVAVKFGIEICREKLHMNQTSDTQSAAARESAIELLARQTGTSVDTVKEIYRIEHDKLERSARIQTFVSLLAHQRVKALLRVERRRRHGTSLIGKASNS
jgi:hypothetical protein